MLLLLLLFVVVVFYAKGIEYDDPLPVTLAELGNSVPANREGLEFG